MAPGHSAEGSVPSSAVLLQSSREGRASAQGGERHAQSPNASPEGGWARAPGVPGELRMLEVLGVSIAFRWIPPGKAMIGSPPSQPGRLKDETLVEATFSAGFWMQETQVTQAQYEAVMGNNPSHYKGDRRPVEMVSWVDVQGFIGRLNQLAAGGGFRLPREMEWEYAARGGNVGPFGLPCSDYGEGNCDGIVPGLDEFHGMTRTRGDHASGRTETGECLGLYDMHGNVWEWCEDWYRRPERAGRQMGRNPAGVPQGYLVAGHGLSQPDTLVPRAVTVPILAPVSSISDSDVSRIRIDPVSSLHSPSVRCAPVLCPVAGEIAYVLPGLWEAGHRGTALLHAVWIRS